MGARRLHLYLAADETSASYQAGRVAGRLFFLAVIPVFVIAFIYWLRGQSRPEPIRFSHAISRWWVWVAGLPTGFLLLVALGFGLGAGNWLSLVICAVIPPLGLLPRIAVEELEMIRVLGEQYRSYQAATHRLVPGLW